jgi:hypothetical protein
MARSLILITLLLAACSTTSEGRSLICLGFCSEQSLKTESTPRTEPTKEMKDGPK